MRRLARKQLLSGLQCRAAAVAGSATTGSVAACQHLAAHAYQQHAAAACFSSASVASGAAASRRSLSTSATAAPSSEAWREALSSGHPANNIPPSIRDKAGHNLLLQRGHPLYHIKRTITGFFAAGSHDGNTKFTCFDNLPPVVTSKQNFDDLLTPPDHVSRKPSDTFYCDEGRLLRCHMTAHQTSLLREGHSAFLMAGEVYRRDAVDATHYPIFHQIDGVRVWSPSDLPPSVRGNAEATTAYVVQDLKASLEGMVMSIFGPGTVSRWVEAYFPFTHPSLELEVLYEGKWLEVLGCGQIRQGILDATGRPDGSVGWAFGMGVERLAMVLYKIPDIRLFWSSDPRFLGQFAALEARPTAKVTFQPFSRQPACYKDVTFWLPGTAVPAAAGAASPAASKPKPEPVINTSAFHENDLFALVREVAGDLVENIERIDAFTHPKSGRTSHCYRILYRSMDKTLSNEEVDVLQEEVRRRLVAQLKVELR